MKKCFITSGPVYLQEEKLNFQFFVECKRSVNVPYSWQDFN